MGIIFSPIINIAVNGVVLYLLTYFVEGITYTGGFKFFVLGGLILGIINTIVRPIVKIISLPFIIISGGLVMILINVGILWFLSYFFSVAQFRDVTLVFPNFSSYVIGAIVFGIINWISNFLIK